MENERNNQGQALFEHEKSAVRAELLAFMRRHPARVPFSVRIFDSLEQAVFNPRLQFATATLGLVLITGSGTAFAAQNALPGEPLYGVKVNIEEPIVGAFATSPQAKANWNAQLAARRLAEAEQLAVQNKLSPTAAATIAVGLNEATNNFDANVAQVATSTSNAAVAASLTSNMQATLAANTQVLNEIASAIPNAAPALRPILSSIEERSISLDNARATLDAAAAQGDDGQIKVAAAAQLGATSGQVNEVATNARSAASSGPATYQVQVAQEELDSGQQNYDDGNYTAALDHLQAAAVNAQAAQISLSIGSQLSAAAGVELPATSSSDALAESTSSDATSADATSTNATGHATSTEHVYRAMRPRSNL